MNENVERWVNNEDFQRWIRQVRFDMFVGIKNGIPQANIDEAAADLMEQIKHQLKIEKM
jgi:hypothetical protein